MTDGQKAQILNAAVAGLTDEQKEQILEGAASSLTEEQKAQIKQGYIQQMMTSDEVTSQINTAVAKVNAAAKQVSELMGQLDSYGAFYGGLLDYTGAVSKTAQGTKELKLNMDALYTNTGKLKISVGEMTDAVGKLYGGTKELANGTAEFSNKATNIDEQISGEIDTMISSVTGNNAETVSFISEKNTNVSSVQFVIKTAAVKKSVAAADSAAAEAPLTFWQKLLRLFGLY